MRTYEDFPINDLLLYAGIDCLVTSNLFGKVLPTTIETPKYIRFEYVEDEEKNRKLQTKDERLLSIMESTLMYTMPALDFIIDMEINGIKYDVEKNKIIKRRMDIEIRGLEEDIFNQIHQRINLDSSKELSTLLYQTMNFTPPHLTKRGEPATDRDALEALSKTTKLDWLAKIAKRNDIAALYRTFIATYVKDFVKADGRVHPSYNLHGTSSFRISGSNPNLTQLPRANHGYNLRELFTVDEGNIFIALDFSSAEVKVLGALCKDPGLLRAIKEGKDFHSFSACNMHGLDYDEFVAVLEDKSHPDHKKYKLLRQGAKALT